MESSEAEVGTVEIVDLGVHESELLGVVNLEVERGVFGILRPWDRLSNFSTDGDPIL